MKFLVIGDETINMSLCRKFRRTQDGKSVKFIFIDGKDEIYDVDYQSVVSALKGDKTVISIK